MHHGAYRLTPLDLAVVAAYLAGVVLIGFLTARRRASTEDFFLASRAARWPVIGLALIASNISSSSLIGLPGAAYATGVSVYNYEWTAVVVIAFSCAFVMPVILRARVFTMPEFLERRFGLFPRLYASGLTVLLNVILDTAGTLYAGALLFQLLAPDVPLWVIAAMLAAVTGLYAVVGGLRSVLATEVLQASVLLVTGFLITVYAFHEVGGWSEVMRRVPTEKLSLIRPADDPGVPWTGLLTGIPVLGFYFWCSNQYMMQQVLSARSLQDARWGSLFAGLLKLPILFFLILPGSAALLIFPELERADQVFPVLLFGLLPQGLVGVAVAGFLAAMMSTLAATYSAASTLLTMDFVARFRPSTSEGALVMTGRIATIAFTAISVAWVPVLDHMSGTLFQYLQSVLSFAVPPMVALFVAGLFWPRANAAGARAGVVVGVLCGVTLYWSVEVAHAWPPHFLFAAALIFAASLAAILIGSLFAPAPAQEAVRPFTVAVADWRDAGPGRRWFTDYRVLGAGLLALAAGLVVWFR